MTASLPAGFTVRAPTREDIPALLTLLNSHAQVVYGWEIFTDLDLRTIWAWPGFDCATDTWIVIAPDGQFVGYGDIWVRVRDEEVMRIEARAYTHPEQLGRGIGTYLLQQTEARARQLFSEAAPTARITLTQFISSTHTSAQTLLDYHGYAPTRHDWIMEINFSEAPSSPEWPDGITLRPFAPGQDNRLVHSAWEDAFQDHRGHRPMPFEHWEQHMQGRENFDPTLWFLAMDSTEIAGFALCYTQPDGGLLADLGVRRPWRRRGLGMALLRHAFGEFYRRGISRVVLGVDAESLTGATRLYERAGMHITDRLDRFERDLRPGKAPKSAG